MKKLLIVIAVVLVAAAGFYNYTVPTFGTYSDGVRQGKLVKVSEKGYTAFTSTWEGELHLGGEMSNAWAFSVADEDLAKELKELAGREMTISYVEHIHVNRFDGMTKYLVTSYELAED